MLMASAICGCTTSILAAAAAAAAAASPSGFHILNVMSAAFTAAADGDIQLQLSSSSLPASSSSSSPAAATVMTHLINRFVAHTPGIEAVVMAAERPSGSGGAFAALERGEGGTSAIIQPIIELVLKAFR
jgi:hypothetical protein